VFEQQDDLAIGPQLTDVDSLGERIVGGLRAQDYKLGFLGDGCATNLRCRRDITNDAIGMFCHQRFERFANKQTRFDDDCR
jgi:hypothetical protein